MVVEFEFVCVSVAVDYEGQSWSIDALYAVGMQMGVAGQAYRGLGAGQSRCACD